MKKLSIILQFFKQLLNISLQIHKNTSDFQPRLAISYDMAHCKNIQERAQGKGSMKDNNKYEGKENIFLPSDSELSQDCRPSVEKEKQERKQGRKDGRMINENNSNKDKQHEMSQQRQEKGNDSKKRSRKKREKIDIRKLELKALLNIMLEKKASEVNLNYHMFPNFLANQLTFAEHYLDNSLNKPLFRLCIITPFDHRLMTTILACKHPRQYTIQSQNQEFQHNSQEQYLQAFYHQLYQKSHFEYFKQFLKMQIEYERRTIIKLRNQYHEIVCGRRKSFMSTVEKKQIQNILLHLNSKQQSQDIVKVMRYNKPNYMDSLKTPPLTKEERRKKIQALKEKVIKNSSKVSEVVENEQIKKPHHKKNVTVIDEQNESNSSFNESNSEWMSEIKSMNMSLSGEMSQQSQGSSSLNSDSSYSEKNKNCISSSMSSDRESVVYRSEDSSSRISFSAQEISDSGSSQSNRASLISSSLHSNNSIDNQRAFSDSDS